LGIDYPSIQSATKGCIQTDALCLPFSAIKPLEDSFPVHAVDLDGQVVIYSAILSEINSMKWIDGFISRGFYPPVALLDKSSSVYGKPASDILWYWFPRLTAK
jgi:hypothetical protein